MPTLHTTLQEVRSCAICREHLPFAPKPVLRAHPNARILLIGQAPGTKVHASGVPWSDASGARLLEWMDVDAETFYDEQRIAIIPMGFCYPGKGKGGDLPPRPECAPTWHPRLFALLPSIRLTILIGQYAQKRYLSDKSKGTLTDNVKAYAEFEPAFIPIVHPSPRNKMWLKKNPWFESSLVPHLQKRVRELL